MAQTKQTEVIHPLGEGDFSFATPGGRVRMSVTKDALTPVWWTGAMGGLNIASRYYRHDGSRLPGAAD